MHTYLHKWGFIEWLIEEDYQFAEHLQYILVTIQRESEKIEIYLGKYAYKIQARGMSDCIDFGKITKAYQYYWGVIPKISDIYSDAKMEVK